MKNTHFMPHIRRLRAVLLLGLCGGLLGGCQSSATDSSTKDASAGKLPAAYFSVNADAIGSDCDALIADFTRLVTDYYSGMRNGSFAQAMSAFPSFYRTKESEWIRANSDLTEDAFMRSNHEWCQTTYGRDYRTTIRVNQLFQLTANSLTEMERIIEQSYGIDCTLEDCYHYSVTETMAGSASSADTKLDWYVLYLPDGCFLYDTLYET